MTMHTLQIMVKAKDELVGRLTDNGGIRKVLDENEKRKLSRGYERAKKIRQRFSGEPSNNVPTMPLAGMFLPSQEPLEICQHFKQTLQ